MYKHRGSFDKIASSVAMYLTIYSIPWLTSLVMYSILSYKLTLIFVSIDPVARMSP